MSFGHFSYWRSKRFKQPCLTVTPSTALPEPGQDPGLVLVMLRGGERLQLLQQHQDISAGRIERHGGGGFVEAHDGAGALIGKGLGAVAEAVGRAVAQVAEGAEQDDWVHAASVDQRRRAAPGDGLPATFGHRPPAPLQVETLCTSIGYVDISLRDTHAYLKRVRNHYK